VVINWNCNSTEDHTNNTDILLLRPKDSAVQNVINGLWLSFVMYLLTVIAVLREDIVLSVCGVALTERRAMTS